MTTEPYDYKRETARQHMALEPVLRGELERAVFERCAASPFLSPWASTLVLYPAAMGLSEEESARFHNCILIGSLEIIEQFLLQSYYPNAATHDAITKEWDQRKWLHEHPDYEAEMDQVEETYTFYQYGTLNESGAEWIDVICTNSSLDKHRQQLIFKRDLEASPDRYFLLDGYGDKEVVGDYLIRRMGGELSVARVKAWYAELPKLPDPQEEENE